MVDSVVVWKCGGGERARPEFFFGGVLAGDEVLEVVAGDGGWVRSPVEEEEEEKGGKVKEKKRERKEKEKERERV